MYCYNKIKFKKVRCFLLLMLQSILFLVMYGVVIYNKNELDCEKLNSSSVSYNLMRKKLETNLREVLSKHVSDISLRKGNNKWAMLMKDVYVYSAYISDCPLPLNSPCLKFIAATLDDDTKLEEFIYHVMCAFKYENNTIIKKGVTTLNKVEESHAQDYTAAIFYCPLQKLGNTEVPRYASLYDNLTLNLTWVPITIKKSASNGIYLSLCVRPFFNSILNIDLAEFITYYSIMGVDHFIFYETSSFQITDVFLRIAKHFGISLELNSWNMPLNESLIHEYGQLAFTQDCIARSKLTSTHTLIVDLDEFITPKKHKDLKMLISHLDKTYPNAASYIVPNVFFCEEFNINDNYSSPFRIFSQNKRQNTVWEHGYRSKVIIRPDRVDTVGIHFVWTVIKNMKQIFVPSSLALLHHYKSCSCNVQMYFYRLLKFYVIKDKIIVDNSLVRLQDKFSQHGIIKFVQRPLENWPKLVVR